jgi:hypothetical protein
MGGLATSAEASGQIQLSGMPASFSTVIRPDISSEDLHWALAALGSPSVRDVCLAVEGPLRAVARNPTV